MAHALLNVSSADPIIVTVGVTQPPLFGVIPAPDGSTQDMTGVTAVFFMRPLLSRTPVINAAPAVGLIPADSQGRNVRYDLQSSDVTLEGNFMGWWGYTLPSSQLAETPEFRILISDHGPGLGTPTGVVVDGLAEFMPITFSALRRDGRFGDRFLQKHADYVKRVVMGVVVSADAEQSYDPLLVEYLSKRTAQRLIAPAKDYWARQHRTVQTQGPSEMASYPDMLKALDDLAYRLRCELVDDWRQLQFLVPGLPQLRVEPMPASSVGDGIDSGYRTPDPQRTRRPSLGGPRWDGIFFP